VVLGPRRYRSHEPVAISAAAPCLIAAPGLSAAAEALVPPRGADQVSLVRADASPAVSWWRRGRVMGAGRQPPAGEVTEDAAGRSWAVPTPGFWQAHEHAADVLSAAVDTALEDVDLAGGTAWDCYGGVGLFAAVLADRVGPTGRVVSVEADRAAAELAARNLDDLPQVSAVAGRVDAVVTRPEMTADAEGRGHFVSTDRSVGAAGRAGLRGQGAADDVDAVILDPPRSGAGATVCRAIAGFRPSVIVYVACDPAALARDSKTLVDSGYRLDGLRAFDAFPQTHHVECVARFRPTARPDGARAARQAASPAGP
jgi:tRNA/tmRNA/rRNA uracil-C5-methylase (TrmA/RlmC/RlmD family)